MQIVAPQSECPRRTVARKEASVKLRRYRIKTPTLAVIISDGVRSTAMVPVDAVVAVQQEVPALNQLIDVVWNNQKYSMFAKDLRERCEPVD